MRKLEESGVEPMISKRDMDLGKLCCMDRVIQRKGPMQD